MFCSVLIGVVIFLHFSGSFVLFERSWLNCYSFYLNSEWVDAPLCPNYYIKCILDGVAESFHRKTFQYLSSWLQIKLRNFIFYNYFKNSNLQAFSFCSFHVVSEVHRILFREPMMLKYFLFDCFSVRWTGQHALRICYFFILVESLSCWSNQNLFRLRWLLNFFEGFLFYAQCIPQRNRLY